MSSLTSTIQQSRRRLNPLAFSPTMWLDSSDPNTLFDATVGGNLVAGDGLVARWADKSGNLNHATQSVIDRRPTRKISHVNSKDAVLFSNIGYPNTDKFMDLPSSISTSMNLPHTFVAVAKSTGPTPNQPTETAQVIMAKEGNHRGLILMAPAPNSNVTLVQGNFWVSSTIGSGITTSIFTNDNVVVAGYRLLTVNPCQVDLTTRGITYKSSIVSGNTLTTGATRIGRARSTNAINNYAWTFMGPICEMLYFTRSLTDNELSLLLSYLSFKWNGPV
jgi:hypothetical protein